MTRPYKLTLYNDDGSRRDAGDYRWRITHGNQHIVASSSEGFRKFNGARDNAAIVTGLDLGELTSAAQTVNHRRPITRWTVGTGLYTYEEWLVEVQP